LPWVKPRFINIARFAPLIGLLIGSIQACIWLFLNALNWSNTSSALLVIALGSYITGGLHLDGLMDTADGLAAGKDRCLDAMKDSSVGASGVMLLAFSFFIQIGALIKLGDIAPYALIVSSFWGRCAPLWAIRNFPYIQSKSGSSGFHKLNWQGWKETIPAITIIIISLLVIAILPSLGIKKAIYFTFLLIGIIPSFLIPHLIGMRLKGHTGDSYGASLVITESINLLILGILF